MLYDIKPTIRSVIVLSICLLYTISDDVSINAIYLSRTEKLC